MGDLDGYAVAVDTDAARVVGPLDRGQVLDAHHQLLAGDYHTDAWGDAAWR